MTTHDHSHHSRGAPSAGSFWSSRAFLVFLGFAAIAIVLLWEEHKTHILGAIPYLFILACPLLHVFMHGGHGGHGGQSDQGNRPDQDSKGRQS